jgi:16S rRNA G966 N2-methylase RsmD
MRIVGGQFRGRLLAAPAHEGTRPTSDRAREAMFNILAHGIPGFDLAGARVLDLFAGTGALGLEALSRGAAFGLFVEQEAEDGGWLASGAIAVIEERKGTAIAIPTGFDALDQRAWGETQALFARFTGGQS